MTESSTSTTNLSSAPPAESGAIGPSWRLVRSDEQMLAGVCRGLAAATGLDVTVVRLAFIASGLAGFGIIAYLVLALVVPRQDVAAGEPLTPAPPDTRRWLRLAIIAGGLVGLVLAVADGPPFTDRDGFGVGLLLLAVGGLIVWFRRGRPTPGFSTGANAVTGPVPAQSAPSPSTWAPPRPDASISSTIGTAVPPLRANPTAYASGSNPVAPGARTPGSVILARVVGWLTVLVAIPVFVAIVTVANIGALSVPLSGLFFALGIAAVAHLVVWSSVARSAAPVVIAIATVVAVGGSVAAFSHWNGEIGEDVARPALVDDVEPVYELAIGHQVIDLSTLRVAPSGVDEAPIVVDQGIGLVEIVVPDDATIDADVAVRAGSIVLLGDETDGWQTSAVLTEPGAPDGLVVTIDAELGFGQVRICRASDAAAVDGHLECDG